MTAIQKKKIRDLEVINNGNDIVTQVHVEWVTYDDSDPEEIKTRERKIFTLETDEVDPTSEDFVPYNKLTQDVIFGWLHARLNSIRIKEMEQRMITEINNRVNPPAPVEPEIINKGLPW